MYVFLLFAEITDIKTAKGYALQDIITEVAKYVTRVKMANETLIGLVTRLADVEHRLSVGTSEKIQLSAMIGAFQIARDEIAGPDS
jgi:replication factor C subunit 3/5